MPRLRMKASRCTGSHAPATAGKWAVRQGPWKLIGNSNDPTKTGPVKADLFLSNLEKDKTEMINYAKRYPEITRRLEKQHDIWIEKLSEAEQHRE